MENTELKLYAVNYTVSIDSEFAGVAIVKAVNPKKAEEIIRSESTFNGYGQYFKITLIKELFLEEGSPALTVEKYMRLNLLEVLDLNDIQVALDDITSDALIAIKKAEDAATNANNVTDSLGTLLEQTEIAKNDTIKATEKANDAVISVSNKIEELDTYGNRVSRLESDKLDKLVSGENISTVNGQDITTGVPVVIDVKEYELTKDKVEAVLVGDINTHNHDTIYYNKELVESKIADFETKTHATETFLPKGNYITDKTVPKNTSDLNNDSGFITNTVSNLANYYKKTDTYSLEEVNIMIGSISTINFKVVETRPLKGEANLIYLVKDRNIPEDSYNEWIYVNNGWELIGNTEVDLSNYYDKTASDGRFALKASVELLETYFTGSKAKEAIKADNAVKLNNKDASEYALSTDIPAKLSQLTDDSTHRVVSDVEKMAWNGKVDKVDGKGLSTNDFTTEEKNKLDTVSNNASSVIFRTW